LTVRNYLNGESADSPIQGARIVILRHDVDRKMMNALRMANLEHEMGIHSTYYFRYPHTFKPDIIKQIYNLGHEVGYHYEVLSKTRGDVHQAHEMFQRELRKFRELCEIKTICMHGSPLSSYDNRNLWQKYDFMSLGLVGDAYLSFQGNEIQYFSDTGRSWQNKHNMRDYLTSNASRNSVTSTDQLIRLIRSEEIFSMYIVVHPERWSSNIGEWAVQYVEDFAMNSGKNLIVAVRAHGNNF
jgi:hypothetical protein